MEEISFFTQLSNEIANLDFANFLIIALFFYVPFYFSRKAESLFFHLLYSYFGLYMLWTMEDPRLIYDFKMIVGLGLLLPQLKFIRRFTLDTIQTVKMMTTNKYYFFVTIYYKILRFINWVKSTYIMLKTFFTTFSFKKEDYYEQDESSSRSYYNEQKHQKFYEEPKYEERKSYQKEETKTKYEEPKQEYKKQSYTKQEEPKSKDKQVHNEFKRFYSESAYTVLGVSADDNYKTIKKVYRKLVRKYHPDLNPNNIKLYTEITQNINDAWEKVESWKK